jgi:hypothetical protein
MGVALDGGGQKAAFSVAVGSRDLYPYDASTARVAALARAAYEDRRAARLVPVNSGSASVPTKRATMSTAVMLASTDARAETRAIALL